MYAIPLVSSGNSAHIINGPLSTTIPGEHVEVEPKKKLLSKKITLSGNSFLTRKWWYEVMTARPPPLPKNSETMRENILDRVEEGWQDEDWETTMPKLIRTLLQEIPYLHEEPALSPRITRRDRSAMGTHGRTGQSPYK